MQRAVLDVHGLLWVMEVDDVAPYGAHLSRGTGSSLLDAVHGRLEVHFDEHVTGLGALQRVVEECYYHCRGERSLGHVCRVPGGRWRRCHPRSRCSFNQGLRLVRDFAQTGA